MSDPLLEVRGLTKHFRLKGRKLFERTQLLRAVDGIDFDVERGSTLGLVGESGCGKTTTARLILRLEKASDGRIRLDDLDVLACSKRELRRLRKRMQLVFQDPLSSPNPRMPVGVSVAEALRFHGIGNRAERAERARQILDVTGLGRRYFQRLPHELSGGQCQRVGIARALVLNPQLVVLDEPVSALDVSVRAQILTLLLDLQERFQLTYVFISHDLSVVRRMCDRTAVLYLGRIVESAAGEELYKTPLHPYTQALIAAIPVADPTAKRAHEFGGLTGDVPSPIHPPTGCPFHTRCPHRMDVCTQQMPVLRDVGGGHRVACFLHS